MSLEADELRHYGVKGMKGGVRKNPSKAFIKAFIKASRKADKLSRHADKMERNYQKANVDLAKQKARFANTNRKARGKLDVGTLEDQTVANVSAETTVALLQGDQHEVESGTRPVGAKHVGGILDGARRRPVPKGAQSGT